jgi:hypothetical protein
MAKICFVSCVSKKRKDPSSAEEMYISPLFQGARTFAKTRFDRWYILSAKYGLLEPGQIIEPYEKTLKKMNIRERKIWTEDVFTDLTLHLSSGDILGFVAGQDYRKFLLPRLSDQGYVVEVPLEGLSIGIQLSWFKKFHAEQKRLAHLDSFYNLLADIEKGVGGKRKLVNCKGDMEWPRMGVYFFFEQGEVRTTDIGMSRVVRVGTHTVSRGSKTTLWHRLRTHRGTSELTGNHRGSIFRLHVGAAMLAKSGGSGSLPTWGVGQTAPADVRKSEVGIEREVSRYIGSLTLLWLAVGDEPSAVSDRSYIERNAIALLSGATGPLDLPGNRWLGRYSSRDAIRRSGLWNINYVTDDYDPRFIDVLAEYVAVTLGQRQQPRSSIAPRDWLQGKHFRNQMKLFREEDI